MKLVGKSFSVLVVAGMISLSWFNVVHPESHYKKGAIIRFTEVTPAGLNYKISYEVLSDVAMGGINKLNLAEKVYDETGHLTGTYPLACFYDKAHWAIEVVMPSAKDMAMDGAAEAEVSDSIVFPYAMKINDTLRPAHGYKKISLKGDYVEYTYLYYNRKVTEKDTVQTSMGAITAFRVESKMFRHEKRKHKLLGDKDQTSIDYLTVWFSPEYGEVKSEITTEYGMSRTTLESIK